MFKVRCLLKDFLPFIFGKPKIKRKGCASIYNLPLATPKIKRKGAQALRFIFGTRKIKKSKCNGAMHCWTRISFLFILATQNKNKKNFPRRDSLGWPGSLSFLFLAKQKIKNTKTQSIYNLFLTSQN